MLFLLYRPSHIPELTEMDRMLLLSHSMAAYATKLPQDHRERFYTRIINDTTDWICSLFRAGEDCCRLFCLLVSCNCEDEVLFSLALAGVGDQSRRRKIGELFNVTS